MLVVDQPAKAKTNSEDSKLVTCYLDEGVAEIFLKTATGFEKIESGRIFTGTLAGGPKRSEGDMRSPWGIYRAVSTIQYASYKAVLLNYPNEYDRSLGATGGEILVHAWRSSVGCISISDLKFLDKVLEVLGSGGAIHIYPSRMTLSKLKIWKDIIPHEGELLENLFSDYHQIISQNDENEIQRLTAYVKWQGEPESWGLGAFPKAQFSGEIDNFIPMLRAYGIGFDSITSALPYDSKDGNGRWCMSQIWTQLGPDQKLPIDTISLGLESSGNLIVFGRKIKNKIVWTVNTGTVEGCYFVKHMRELQGARPPKDAPTVVYVDGKERLVASMNQLPFVINKSELWNPEKGLNIVATNPPVPETDEEGYPIESDELLFPLRITFVQYGERMEYGRAAGESNLYVPVDRKLSTQLLIQ